MFWAADARDMDLDVADGFAFVEYHPMPGDNLLYVVGTPAWWRETGSARLDAANRQDVADDVRKPGITWIESSTSGPFTARYVIALDDISTRDDRAHWVARGRMRLTDRRDGRVVAEYVGFSASHKAGYLRDEYPDHQWEETLECPGPERRYAGGEKRWQALRFFFSEVVRAK